MTVIESSERAVLATVGLNLTTAQCGLLLARLALDAKALGQGGCAKSACDAAVRVPVVAMTALLVLAGQPTSHAWRRADGPAGWDRTR